MADSNILYDDIEFQQNDSDPSSLSDLSLASRSSLSETSSASIALPEITYVPVITALPGTASFAAVLSSASGVHKLSTFDLATSQCLRSYPDTEDVITAIRNVEKMGGNYSQSLLLSSSKDSTVKVWDTRNASSAPSLSVQTHKKVPILSFDISDSDGCLLAAGSELVSDEASIHFWDVRWPEKILHRHTSTHSDDITCVHFQPPGNRSGEILLSASSDGLICTTDARQSDEDEAGLFVGSWQRSVSHCGWMGSSGVWSASDMETLTVWSNELDVACDYGNMRQPTIAGTWKTDYIIDSAWLPPNAPLVTGASTPASLGVWLGNNNGDFALFTSGNERSLALQRKFAGGAKGHSAIVRSIVFDLENNCILSGGEDSTICVWPLQHIETSVMKDEDGDAVMDRASPPCKVSSSTIRKRKNEEINTANKKGRKGV